MKTIKEIRESEVRAIHRRQDEIWGKILDLEYIKLEKPIRHGWYKEIVITQKVERYKNEKYILELFNIIEKRYWGRTKKEADKRWFHQVSIYNIYKDFPTISKKQFNKLSNKAQKMCFPYRVRNQNKKLKVRFYIRIPKAAYRVKYTRAYNRYYKQIDPQLLSENARLENQLLSPKYYEINQARYPWKDDWELSVFKKEKLKINRELRQLRNLPIQKIKENSSWERN